MPRSIDQPYFFSSDIYLRSLAEVFFPKQRCDIRESSVGGKTFRLLFVNNKPVTSFPFLDFHLPIQTKKKAASTIKYIQNVALEEVVFQNDNKENTVLASDNDRIAPFIALSSYASWEHYRNSLYEKNSKFVTDTARRRRKLESEQGEITFIYNDSREETFGKLVDWKSNHYHALGGTTMFLNKKILTFFKFLQKKGAVIVSSLSVDGTVVAAHLGAYDGKTLYSWIPSYDKTYAKYSPGRILLMKILEECYAQGIERFEFLLGGESYKWYFSTHFRPVTSLGTMPVSHHFFTSLQEYIKQWMLRISPSLFYRSKKLVIFLASTVFSIREQKLSPVMQRYFSVFLTHLFVSLYSYNPIELLLLS